MTIICTEENMKGIFRKVGLAVLMILAAALACGGFFVLYLTLRPLWNG